MEGIKILQNTSTSLPYLSDSSADEMAVATSTASAVEIIKRKLSLRRRMGHDLGIHYREEMKCSFQRRKQKNHQYQIKKNLSYGC
jgi:hypothetical protein